MPDQQSYEPESVVLMNFGGAERLEIYVGQPAEYMPPYGDRPQSLRVESLKLSGLELIITLKNMGWTLSRDSPSPKTPNPEKDG